MKINQQIIINCGSLLLLYFSCVLQAQCPEQLFISHPNQIAVFSTQYAHCDSIYGSVVIEGFQTDDIIDLSGLYQIKYIGKNLFIGNHLGLKTIRDWEQLTEIEGNLIISNNLSLEEVGTFANLKTIGGDLIISNNPVLQNFSFPSLTSIQQNLEIFYNPSVQNLVGFEALVTIESSLKILRNEGISSLQGLTSLQFIRDGLVLYGNPSLESLRGLELLGRLGDRLLIIDNKVLANCTIGICSGYIPNHPHTEGYIHSNVCGCNSQEEIRTTCLGDSVNCNYRYTIGGRIQTSTGLPIGEVKLHLTGAVVDSVLTDEYGNYRFENLPRGEYFVEPSKEGMYINGITLVDASLIFSHASGNPPLLDDPIKVLAADIDQSQSITIEDGNLVKQLAQGAIEEWKTVPAWGFVRANFNFKGHTNNPWLASDSLTLEPTINYIPSLQRNNLFTNFIGFKYGDTNCSIRP